ncbi:hybrid sensor histidine kinase/response regulator transcription factor [Aestuariibaculum lutulentum]|uniref:histidine kinase n=1 Tax=Aestuariibaculum lutulentum TaxID=2920935 RepID=A0ABS9RKY0_9FLAO|nr:two-component regulator propeller domain-containing protein [Aestuariibaculum lutulentum]MCH4553611.1 ATP-binding protein [Aestuariibaculum lutulentum]
MTKLSEILLLKRDKKYICLWLCLMMFSRIFLAAQTKTYRIKHFSLNDGMSQVSVNDLAVDKQGFVWVGTADGLNRFDGTIFKEYRNRVADSLSLSGNYISGMALDFKGLLWVGTKGNGLCVYSTLNDRFDRIDLHGTLSKEIITDISPEAGGNILVATRNHGIYNVNPFNRGVDGYVAEQVYDANEVTCFYKDDYGWIWIGDVNGQVKGFKHLNQNPEVNMSLEGNIQAFYRVGNQLFIGSYEGFYIYDIDKETFKNVELETSGAFKTMHVVDFLEEGKNQIWVATGRGLYLFNSLNNQVLHKIEYLEESDKGLTNNTVQSLHRLSDKKILVGTASGLNILDFQEPYFKNISKSKKGRQVLNDDVIFSVYKDYDNLWIGTSDGGLNLITPEKVYHYIDNKNTANSIAGSVVRAIVHDIRNQRMWFGTTRGLSMINLKTFNPDQPVFKNFYYDAGNSNSINMNFVMDLALDDKNNLWGATYEQGIFRLEYEQDGTFNVIRYYNDSDDENSLVSNATQCIRVDKQNRIWIGTQNGLSQLSFQKEPYSAPIFLNYKRNDSLENTLAHNAINDIVFDNYNRVWLGTRNGLSLLKADNTFQSWRKQKQFPNDLIYSIQDDLEGNLWLGTNNGIVKFNTKNYRFSHYYEADNIQGKEFDSHARFRDVSGNIYLGGIDGLSYFNPEDFDTLDAPQKLYFSNLRVKDKTIEATEASNTIFTKALEKSSQLTFNYDQFPFYLSFSSIDFRFDKNIQYAYKLLPQDKAWNFLTNNEIQFLNLSSGDYTLQVNGFSRGQEWASKPLEMHLIIKAPWWSTKTAYFIYFLIFVLSGYWFYNFTVSRKLALSESKRLQEIDSLKNSLYTNITHEFRTPLTVILGLIDELKSETNKQELKALYKPLEVIQRNAGSLLKLVNDMLDLTKLESAQMELDLEQSDIVSYLKYLFESFESLAKDEQIRYEFHSREEHFLMDFDKDKLAIIVTNLLMNAIKFTSANGSVTMQLSTLKSTLGCYFEMQVIDTGIGLSKEEMTLVFEKFYQVDSSISRHYQGTGIGLALVKELVLLMEGEIQVSSEVSKGSTFSILLPVKNEAQIVHSNIETYENGIQNIKQNVVSYEIESQQDIDQPIALIIEDNKDIVYYLKMCLTKDYLIHHAPNGKDGLDMAYKLVPDVIICDVMMPIKNGFEVCRELKSNAITDHIPIILLTAKSLEEDRLEGLACGADAYLIKPFNKKELLVRLNRLVELRKRMIDKFRGSYTELISRETEPKTELKFVNKIISVIHENIDDSHFNSAQLAQILHMSESQLYRKLKAVTDKSTAIFIRSVRLQKSKMLIQTTDKTISEIAYAVGFNDPSWFSRAFKEEFGFSPSDLGKS